ncbi:MAG: ABC transporter substrate-binding protein [Oscillospiraceae bacterium]|nr:ABC transporter substrate-binding protein [Oscillospiraceae bacterium]
MSKLKRIIALITALMLALALCGCSSEEVGTEINIAVLSGPTGIGAVYLMEANDNGETTNSYNFTVSSVNDDVVAGLTSGEYDIAAVATNVAANLYNKTDGAIQICALNTYGVLYILENGDSIQSVEDLRGKTIYATGQGANPEYVLDYVLTQNGIDPENDVTIEFMDSSALVTLMASGEAEVCMLPVPAVTNVMIQNSDIRIALDMTEEWNNVTDEGQLTMGCVVVRTEFAEENPEAVEAFLEEYAESIENVQANVEHAAELCETYEIVAKSAVALKAIPDCNLCCITGDEIRTTIEPYYTVLYNANASSIGGVIPDEDFYFAK